MAYAYTVYSAGSSQTDYTIAWPYIKEEHVKVYVNFVDTSFTFHNATTARLASAPASGTRVEVRRVTPPSAVLVDYADGSTLTASDLDTSNLQHLYIAQELDDNQKKGVSISTTTGLPTLGSKRLTEVADPTAAQDAATKNYVDTAAQPVDAELTELATMSSGTAAALADLTAAEVQAIDGITSSTNELNILDGVTASTAELNYVDGVTSNVQTQLNAKQPLDAELTELATMSSDTAAALADLTQAEVQLVDGATLTTTELNYVDGVTSAIQTQIDGKQPLDADLTSLSSCQSGAAVNLALLTSGEVAVLDGATLSTNELNTLTGITSTTAELNKLDGVTSTPANLNVVSGMTKATTLTSNSDTEFPTSKAVNDRILTVTNALGGFVAIANETSFPTANPDPSNGAGTVVSISDAGGVVVNGSGVASITNGAGTGNTVTINGFPSSLQSKTLAAGIGLQVQTTTTLHTYTYHKVLAKEADVEQLSNDIDDFKARYRVVDSLPNSDNDEGDLVYNRATDKMMVYDSTTSQFKEVQSIGSFNFNTLSSYNGTGGNSASFNGSAYRFVLNNPPSFAQQLICSVNGVIQKPNTGTSQPSEGFAIDGSSIIFSAAPASNAPFFAITLGSTVNIGTVSDGTVTEAKLSVGNDPTNGKFLQAQSGQTGGMLWADVPVGVGGANGVDFNDDIKARWGTGNDLEIFHDNTNQKNVIKNISGSTLPIELAAQTVNIQGVAQSAFSAKFSVTGGQELYFGGAKKAETVTGGFTITGACTATSFAGDGSALTGIGGGVTTSATRNTAAGDNAGDSFSGGTTDTTLYGFDAGTAITSGDYNTFIGSKTGDSTTTGAQNTIVGASAFEDNVDGNYNTGLGYYSLKVNTASDNVAIGYAALSANTTGTQNTALGRSALSGVVDGNYNIGIGFDSGKGITSGGGNIAIGHKSGDGITTGSNNIAIGYEALSDASMTSANNVIAIGYRAAYETTTENQSIAIGYQALKEQTTVTGNTAVGHKALENATGGQYTALGVEAGNDCTTGHSGVFIGWQAGSKVTTGIYNTAVGRDTLGAGAGAATTAGYCVAVGSNALNDVTSGGFNYAVGNNAGQNITTGTDNVLMGYSAGGALTSGTTNCAVGCGALQNEASISGNAAMGKFAGLNCGGNNNVYIGNNAGHSHNSGNNSVIIGNEANYNQESGSNVLFIARGNVAKGSNSCWIYGDGDGNVIRAGNGTAWATTSDARIKKNIVDNNVGLSLINQVRIRNFEYRTEDEIDRTNFGGKADDPKWTADEAKEMNSVTEGEYKTKYGIDQSGIQLGVIAQELETVAPRCVKTDATGKKTVDSTELLWHMLNAIKELSAKNTALEARITTLEAA